MKSNQERSNECLPPKKREIPASTIPSAASSLPSEERPLVVAQASESQRGENLAWLASVVSVHEGREQRMSASSLDADGPQYKPLSVDYSSSSTSTSSSSSSSSITSSALTFTSSQSSRGLPLGLTTLPAIYSSPFSQPGGAIQYTPLPHNVHFITPPYAGPYAGYISPLAPPPPPPPPPPPSSTSGSQRSSSFSSGEAYSSSATNNNSSSSSSSKLDQHHHHHHHQHHNHQQHQQQQSKGSDPATQAHSTQYIPVPSPPVNAPRTSASPHGPHGPHGPLPHHQHTLAQLVLQYSDSPLGPKKEMMNGALEKNRRFGPSPESKPGGTKGGSTQQQQQQQQHHQPGLHHYEARHVVLPAEYAQDVAGLRTSLMFVPNSHGGGSDPVSSADKLPDKGGICSGKPVTRTPSSSSSSSSSHPFLPPPLAVDSHKGAPTVIQTTHSTTEALSLGLPSASFYTTQQPIIGYISGAAGAQTPLGYHSGPLPHHLLIPGTQPVIIPVSGSGPSGFDPVPCSVSTATSTCASSSPSFASSAPLPHTFLAPAPPKGDSSFEMPAPYPHPPTGQVMQAQLHLPLVQTQLHLPPAPLPPAAPPSLPPYFAKGSIIQLADGELKRVEDLGTEDFLQSAEISADLRIDSSTVERISGSPTPNYAIVQFAVGEHRAQVSVEVLMEYPFFVFGQGWSSCCPERTTQTLELPCTKLSVGDVCISLSLKNLKNGALKKNQNQNQTAENQSGTHYLAPPPPPPPLKPPKASLLGVWGARGGGGGGGGEKENGQRRAGRGGASGTENGELRPGERGGSCRAPPDSLDPDPPPKPVTRKRRWSAPEGRKVERPDEEHPLAPPKALFLSREVKISIEGHSSMAD
ncbi:LOW QUALITY PROTEIN: ataxin-1-like [Clupea harengus]|uniref:LOW QUALITY PROTEIN: ataxin-1-like n=1 Tax=Clupea harengus TaxID=7950 RepID=A0A6P8GUE5_CLUHA|nr:LOW QUALITY PROTEIN: ataxin-1-like [Clupea harengus]